MKIERVTWQYSNDFNALMKCEWCGHTQEDKGLYNDQFYHERVIPGRHYCGACGKNGLLEKRPMPETAPTASGNDAEARSGEKREVGKPESL